MSVDDLLTALHEIIKSRPYIIRFEIMDQSVNMLKARLFINPDLFVQVYRNDKFNSTNYALIYNRQRIYARDQLGGKWHRHEIIDPELHDKSEEGRRPVSLSVFMDDVEILLTEMDLP
jgi:hypothetical protein